MAWCTFTLPKIRRAYNSALKGHKRIAQSYGDWYLPQEANSSDQSSQSYTPSQTRSAGIHRLADKVDVRPQANIPDGQLCNSLGASADSAEHCDRVCGPTASSSPSGQSAFWSQIQSRGMECPSEQTKLALEVEVPVEDWFRAFCQTIWESRFSYFYQEITVDMGRTKFWHSNILRRPEDGVENKCSVTNNDQGRGQSHWLPYVFTERRQRNGH